MFVFNLPIALTLARIVLIPVFLLVFYLPWEYAHVAAAGLFALAGITDWFDGYLARKLNQVSDFGAFLDPVADKLIVAAALIVLVQAHPFSWVALPAVVIIGREIVISALREWMAELGQRSSVAVSWIGKVKTSAQMGAIFFMLIDRPVGPLPSFEFGVVLLYLAAGLTLWSMFLYLRAAWQTLR